MGTEAMTDLTNAPPLPEPPARFDLIHMGMFTRPNGTWVAYDDYAKAIAVATTLRAQQSPMRESAIIKGLERQLAEARGEIAELKQLDDVTTTAFDKVVDNCRELAIQRDTALEHAKAATARADAWRAYALHQEWCQVCADCPDDCHDGKALKPTDAALGAPT